MNYMSLYLLWSEAMLKDRHLQKGAKRDSNAFIEQHFPTIKMRCYMTSAESASDLGFMDPATLRIMKDN